MSRGTALITGASSGIGAALAKQCAAGGYDVVLVARRADMLAALARELTAAHGIDAQVITADLAQESAPDELAAALNGRAIDILINNAGFGVNGPFVSNRWEDERRLLQVNVLALVRLTKLILPAMVQRGSGRVLNVASTAAFVPGPFMAMYYASKAFVFSFSLSIANEVKGSGVTVTALCPGPTRTEFGDVAGISGSRLFRGPAMSSEEVAKEGYDAMMAGKTEVIAGARNRWMILGTRLAPRTMLAAITRRLNSSLQ
ncbi:MAG TPA: SDR family oxidoreductase [Candidatus Acidoferrum sp.]|jgi:short-subunit dehydrogenase|nr:SDR family oxidoreductase [Candidatus Acidoferrum sp.]